ncbi:anti-sigma regulatory factor [Leptolyngbya sp. BC1307]|uniref:ATP-binding protein n=1 Tax=Leptolyngbya sp. BC1307 TaxID=2029589 RepID=UPI0023E7B604|nr:anti-sigma regulatory factor [Leptolyngbya sp. BC1307]
MNTSFPGESSNLIYSATSVVKSPAANRWESLSFTSTLYLCPILDALLEPTPDPLRDELRLGLQEALVNAAKHGNGLDPQKVVSVRYARAHGYYWWIVTDQGNGFERPAACLCPSTESPLVSECGRGLYILHQVFDQVCWSEDGKEVHLIKQMQPSFLPGWVSAVFMMRAIEAWWRKWLPISIRSA